MRHTSTLLTAIALTLAVAGAFEMYWRSEGVTPSVNPSADQSLWAFHRVQLDASGSSLAILGTSRALFDIDISTLRANLGASNIRQLAIAATHPMASLEDLAEDRDFNGTVLCEINEEALAHGPWESQRAYNNRRAEHFTLPERWGGYLRARIEDHVAILNPAVSNLNRIKWNAFGITDVRTKWTSDRTSACVPGHEMPIEWNLAAADAALSAANEDLGSSFETQLARFDAVVNRLHSRGVQVIFVRAPVAPEMERLYEHYLPRAQFWDRMVAAVDAPFIRSDDYAALDSFMPPDGSHLCADDPRLFTQRLLDILRRRKLL
jgi:hypothetical protein